MSLDLTKLAKVVELGDGVKRARCPACAESGSDKSGVHLRIYADGKFGCCVHPGNREHRQRIFALAGQRGTGKIKVRVAATNADRAIQSDVLGRLGRTFSTPSEADEAEEVRSEKYELESEGTKSRTERTGETNCKPDTENSGFQPRTARTGQTEWTGELFTDERTLRTTQYSLVLQQEGSERGYGAPYIYKEFDEGVRSVRGQSCIKLPYLTAGGDLVIPFSAPERYFWWRGGQSVKQTLAELREREKEVENGAAF